MSQKYSTPPPERFLSIASTCVGCGPGGSTPALARIAIVDYRGQIVYCEYVKPDVQVSDYRTATTGIEASHLDIANGAKPFTEVQQHVANLIRGKVLVGHSIWHDLSVLGIPHPAVATRDVALYQPFRNALRSPNQVDGKVCALENARAGLDLYRSHATAWEGTVSTGQWPSFLPPSTYSRCYV
ncbi:ribonuclease H-like protein [Sparassis crispa]|uniref:Ribonuclease H-like protein n=1 Tax=Sparassis crispa TaxID=139825 RepID=A0A401G6I9_9APHY|nr:ribonuclease H-like protein [Sparassis crispa]GBE77778.1 ribonuclease H-like protein [Sparassis crispa]